MRYKLVNILRKGYRLQNIYPCGCREHVSGIVLQAYLRTGVPGLWGDRSIDKRQFSRKNRQGRKIFCPCRFFCTELFYFME